MIIDEDVYLAHYGTPRKSGRYPWGSGGETDQLPRSMELLDHIANMRKKGLTDPQIAEGMGISTTKFRALNSIAKNERKQAEITQAVRLWEAGNSKSAIGRIMGKNESYVRTLLKDGEAEKADILQTTANMLKDEVAERTYLDVGTGVEAHLGISATKLNTAVSMLQQEGYTLWPVNIPQVGTGLETRLKILAPPGTTQKDVFLNRDKIRQISRIESYSEDGGRTYTKPQPPISVDSKRVAVIYGKDGGAKADGVIYVRPGVEDISLGQANYAQVRIKVGETHYLKGMAMYKDRLPEGVDLMFNTNKEDTGNKLDAMKEVSADPTNPFGAIVRQIKDPKNPDRVTSAMNIVREEGEWAPWSRTISTQMLSKQSPHLARSQLDMTYEQHLREYEDISRLTNPTVRKALLEKFGDSMDSSAVHLDAAAISTRQGWHAILPISSMPPGQVYAPNFRPGEKVVLIRFPHAGTFEIPELVVNNNHPEAKRLLGNARDAVGIHHSVAERLSGADFDGDTVLVIPNNSNKIKSSPALEQLKNFDPRTSYKPYDGMKTIDGGTYNGTTKKVDYEPGKPPSGRGKGIQMGLVSNLITDMTLKGASTEELARAVKHSMVVIDAEKHNLNYKQSAKDNGIAALKERYQGKKAGGASTLISRATAKQMVPETRAGRKSEGGPINKDTGERILVPTGKIDFRTGQQKQVKSTRLAETTDAATLSSGTPMERLYSDHSNKLKALANRARKESINTPRAVYSPSARKVYDKEVQSLNAKLDLAERNRPLERQAQVVAAYTIKAKRDANPNMDEAMLKKVKFVALEDARNRTGASKHDIIIEPNEWDAIQAGAISDSKLQDILRKADVETVRKLATPRDAKLMSPAMATRAKQMKALGFTRADIADQLGVSLTTLDTATNE